MKKEAAMILIEHSPYAKLQEQFIGRGITEPTTAVLFPDMGSYHEAVGLAIDDCDDDIADQQHISEMLKQLRWHHEGGDSDITIY